MNYIFVGNRKYVLEEMIKNNLSITNILVMKNSHLEKEVSNYKINFGIISSKKELLQQIIKTKYDILISNGCKYILPIRELKKAKYINIHPSYLPDLKGMDPINGALLLNRDIGATCHYMNDYIDSGDIISRKLIKMTEDLDAGLLYQLCFRAEKEVFIDSLSKNFEKMKKQPILEKNHIYYTQKLKDRFISFEDDVLKMIRQVKAYGYKSKGCFFGCNKNIYKFFDIDILSNEYIIEIAGNYDDLEVIFSYEDSIIFKKDDVVIKFSKIEKENKLPIHENDYLYSCSDINEGYLG